MTFCNSGSFKGLTDDTHGGKLDVFIALDKSGSMQETWLEQAGRLSWEVGQAVEQSGGRCKVLGFDTDIYHYKNTPERYTIPGRGGGTHLASIMSEAVLFFRQSNPDNGKLLVMLTDTDLGDVDRVIKMLHVLRQAGVVIWMGAILPHVSPEENDSGNVVDELQKACPFMNAGAAKLREVDCWRTPAIHDMLMGAVKEFLMDFRKAMVGR